MSLPALTSPASAAAAAVLPPRAFALPALPRRGERHDGLSPAQRRLMVGAILTAHAAAVWGLLQVQEVRDAVADVAPMFVSLIAPPKPPEPVVPPPPPPPRAQQVPVKKTPLPMVTAAPSPAPAVFETPAPPPVPVAEPQPVVVAAAPAPVPAPPAPPPQPKIIPASAVQYLEPIALEYPRLSKRMGESGRVLVRVYIDEAGNARNAQVNRSSGHPRLDDAALAAVQKARFKPYTENGRAVAGWAFIPLEFELEK